MQAPTWVPGSRCPKAEFCLLGVLECPVCVDVRLLRWLLVARWWWYEGGCGWVGSSDVCKDLSCIVVLHVLLSNYVLKVGLYVLLFGKLSSGCLG